MREMTESSEFLFSFVLILFMLMAMRGYATEVKKKKKPQGKVLSLNPRVGKM